MIADERVRAKQASLLGQRQVRPPVHRYRAYGCRHPSWMTPSRRRPPPNARLLQPRWPETTTRRTPPLVLETAALLRRRRSLLLSIRLTGRSPASAWQSQRCTGTRSQSAFSTRRERCRWSATVACVALAAAAGVTMRRWRPVLTAPLPVPAARGGSRRHRGRHPRRGGLPSDTARLCLRAWSRVLRPAASARVCRGGSGGWRGAALLCGVAARAVDGAGGVLVRGQRGRGRAGHGWRVPPLEGSCRERCAAGLE